jgi:hypothetical protein
MDRGQRPVVFIVNAKLLNAETMKGFLLSHLATPFAFRDTGRWSVQCLAPRTCEARLLRD